VKEEELVEIEVEEQGDLAKVTPRGKSQKQALCPTSTKIKEGRFQRQLQKAVTAAGAVKAAAGLTTTGPPLQSQALLLLHLALLQAAGDQKLLLHFLKKKIPLKKGWMWRSPSARWYSFQSFLAWLL